MSDQNYIPKMAFAGGELDHAETRRDPESLQSFIKSSKAKAIILDNGKPAVNPDGTLIMVHPDELIGKQIGMPGPLFLGLDGNAPVFAFIMEGDQSLAPNEAFQEMRFVASRLDPKSLAIAGRAKSLFDWHLSHRFCSACGKESHSVAGGMNRTCPSCKSEHFPRVNPVVIMLVLHGDDCLLGRSPGWPEGAFSALAGFVSPGETMEEAVEREVMEEVGIRVTDPKYIFSQPWPFPSQLMIGMVCQAKSKVLKINKGELEDAQWFSKDKVRAVFAKESEAFLRPPGFTIANQLLRYWLAE